MSRPDAAPAAPFLHEAQRCGVDQSIDGTVRQPPFEVAKHFHAEGQQEAAGPGLLWSGITKDERVGDAFTVMALPGLTQGVIVRMHGDRVSDVANAISMAPKTVGPLDVLGVLDGLLEGKTAQGGPACRRIGHREEVQPARGLRTVTECALGILDEQAAAIRPRHLPPENSADRGVSEWSDEAFEPILVDRRGIGIEEHEDVGIHRGDRLIEHPAGVVAGRIVHDDPVGMIETPDDLQCPIGGLRGEVPQLEGAVSLFRQHFEGFTDDFDIVVGTHHDGDFE